jgi:hypothetical protein
MARRKLTNRTPKGKKNRKADDTIWRVVPMAPATRDILKAARVSHGTNAAAIDYAISHHLPTTIRALAQLGIGAKTTGAKAKRFRLPFSETGLAALRLGAETTGLDSTFLLKVVLACLE